MGKGSDPPPKQDFAGQAVAQGADNRATALHNTKLSNPNFNNPFGSRKVAYDDATGVPTVNDTLSSDQQHIFDNQQQVNMGLSDTATGMLPGVQQSLSKPFSFDGVTGLVDKANDALMARLNPQMERMRAARETAAITGGHAKGSEGWNTLQTSLGQQENDQQRQTLISALGYAPQLMQGEVAARTAPLNLLNATRSGSQATVPQFQAFQGSNAAPAPIMQAAQLAAQEDMNTYNANTAQSNSAMSGILGLAGAAVGGMSGGGLPGAQLGASLGRSAGQVFSFR